jgi:type I restriction enzyme S subunit
MSLTGYSEYTDSGVEWLGQIPSHWGVKRLRFVAEINPSKSEVAHLAADTEVSFLPMEAIGENGSLELDRVRPLVEVQTGYTFFRDGDVTIAKITPCFENGKGAAMRGLCNGIGFGTTELIVTRPKGSKTTSAYLHWLFTSRPFRKAGEAFMYGAGGQKRVPDDFVRDFEIGFPPIEEQVSIATFLDHESAKIDALVGEQKRLIELLKEKRQAVISRAVTKGLDPNVPMKDSGVEWLGEVPAHWEVSRLRYVARPGTSITYGIVQAGPHIEDGIPYIKTSDMSGQTLPLDGYSKTTAEIDASYARSRVAAGDLVIAIRASVGKCLPVPTQLDGANLTQGTAKISPSAGVDAGFLLAYVNAVPVQTYLNSVSKGATFKEITLDTLRKTPVLLPPPTEQRLIASHAHRLNERFQELIDGAEAAEALLVERRSALISAAVNGKIDVREAA